jgi:hypothetical protein
MATDQVLLDAFAEARRTWDDLVSLQPDIKAASGPLSSDDLAELEKRVGAHDEAVQSLANTLERVWSASRR